MYLKDLMQGEKYAFYSVVKRLVSVDNDFSEAERKLMDEFLVEMEISEDQITDIGLEDAIDMFAFSSFSTRKKVFIELVGVTLCDELFDVDERDFLINIAERFGIAEDDRDSIVRMVHNLLDLYKDLQDMIDKE